MNNITRDWRAYFIDNMKSPGDALYMPHPKLSEPMSADTLAGCCRFLKESRSLLSERVETSRVSDTTAITTGLPQGGFIEAAYFDLCYGRGILFTSPDREARLVTPAQYCIMRLLALPGRDCVWWFDRSTKKDLPDEEQRWYLRYSHGGGIWGLRILANAQPEQVVVQRIKKQSDVHLGHKDLRPSNLEFRSRRMMLAEGKPMRRTYRGRDDAVEHALRNFGKGFSHLNIDAQEYASVMKGAFELLDQSMAHEAPWLGD